jgi:hypothetical protein
VDSRIKTYSLVQIALVALGYWFLLQAALGKSNLGWVIILLPLEFLVYPTILVVNIVTIFSSSLNKKSKILNIVGFFLIILFYISAFYLADAGITN